MAGDWIPVRISLSDDPDVIAIAAHLGTDEDAVVGKLVRFWGWADQHTTDGNASSVTYSWIDKRIGVTGFCAALESRGWICATLDGISIPNFERFLGKSGKTRAKTSARVAKHREMKRSCNGDSVTESLPQKRREEKRVVPNGTTKSQTESATRRKHSFSDWDAGFVRRMHADIVAVVPSALEPSWDAWANDVRLLREQDHRSEGEIETLWAFANADDFWRSNILSPRKLREKWVQLEAKRAAKSRAGPPGQPHDRLAAVDSFIRNNGGHR